MRAAITLLVLFFAQANIFADVESDKAAGTQALSESKFEQAVKPALRLSLKSIFGTD